MNKFLYFLINIGLVLLSVFLQRVVFLIFGAIAYTNSMALVSDQADKEQQGEIMGVAVSVQSCAEFLPASTLGLIAFISQALPLFAAALFAVGAYLILRALISKVPEKISN